MDITKMSVTELKALAFDTLVSIENFQRDLQTINKAIAQAQTPVPTPLPEVKPEAPVEPVE